MSQSPLTRGIAGKKHRPTEDRAVQKTTKHGGKQPGDTTLRALRAKKDEKN